MSDFLGERRNALEEKFFHAREARLLAQMREQHQRETARATIQAATGISDAKTLDELARLGLTGETVLALAMYPLVAVAWADQSIDPEEKKAILEAAEKTGMPHDSPARGLLASWLESAPPAELRTAWLDYVKALRGQMNQAAFTTLGNEISTRARKVAEAAGGYFGLGKVSDAEKKTLKEIEAAFTG